MGSNYDYAMDVFYESIDAFYGNQEGDYEPETDQQMMEEMVRYIEHAWGDFDSWNKSGFSKGEIDILEKFDPFAFLDFYDYLESEIVEVYNGYFK